MNADADTRDADIAIIGLSGLFAGCKDKDALWDTVVSKQDQVRDAPDSWAKPWFDPDADHGLGTSRIGVRKVGLIGDLAVFDPLEFGMAPKAVEGDPAHFLALRLANDALRDANYLDRPFDRERTGIIVGHGTNPNRGDIAGFQIGLGIDQTLNILRQVLPNLTDDDLGRAREGLKGCLAGLEMEQIPSLVSNVITGRIANRLDLMGPNYLVDAACASSLIAADMGIRDLREGRCDMVLVGGLQASMPAQIYMLFQLLGALSYGEIRPFDQAAGGTLLGEGVGYAVLKRLPDAIRDDDQIYAVIKGIGIASDGKASGLLAPRLEGEALAIRRAYAQTGIDPSTIGLIEAHGTGIPLGDRTEIGALKRIFGGREAGTPRLPIGSVKSMIGHCIPAAGLASIIKTSLALHYKILPPTICDRVSAEIGIEDSPFYVNTEVRPWIHGGSLPRRAGINAFGFGGINAHAILEEYREPLAIPPANIGRWLLRHEETDESRGEALSSSTELPWRAWPSELFVFAGESREAVLTDVRELIAELESVTDLAALARRLYRDAHGEARLAVVARSNNELREKLALVTDKLPDWKRASLSSKKGIHYSEAPSAGGKVAFMFSSEGSQYPDMLRELCLYLPKVRGWFDFLDDTFPRSPRPSTCIFPPPTCLTEEAREALTDQLYAGDLATESVSTASQAMYEVVRDLGIECDVMIGHSAGEHAALRASGMARVLSMQRLRDEMRGLNRLYEDLERSDRIATGTLVSLGGISYEIIQTLLRELTGTVHLVSDNCPSQVILFAEKAATPTLLTRLKTAGAIYTVLPLDRAYHTPLFRFGVEALRQYYKTELTMGTDPIPVMSCSTVEIYPEGADAALDVSAQQWERPVRFREAIEKLYLDGVRVFVELGASNSLVAFVDNILKGRDYLAVATNVQSKPALEQLQTMLAQLFVAKVPMDLSPLYDRRGLTDAENSSVRAHPKPSMPVVLKGELPMLTLEPALAAQLGRCVSGGDSGVHGPTDPPSASAALSNRASVAPSQTTLSSSASEAGDRQRQQVLDRHFEMMQEFLKNQANVLGLLSAHMTDTRDD